MCTIKALQFTTYNKYSWIWANVYGQTLLALLMWQHSQKNVCVVHVQDQGYNEGEQCNGRKTLPATLWLHYNFNSELSFGHSTFSNHLLFFPPPHAVAWQLVSSPPNAWETLLQMSSLTKTSDLLKLGSQECALLPSLFWTLIINFRVVLKMKCHFILSNPVVY